MKTSFNCFPSFRFARYQAMVVLGLVAAAGQLSAGSLKYIAVSASAVPNYVRPLDGEGKPVPETYIFSKGKFMGGNTADAKLKQVSFEDITRMLATNLTKQNYFPTKDVPSANLLLMVSWGTTQVYYNPDSVTADDRMNAALTEYKNSAAANNGDADPGALNQAMNEQNNANFSAKSAVALNSSLLGYKPTLQKEQSKVVVSAAEMTMNEELNEERYFVIVMAYDYQYMKKEHKSKLLWTTRISVRSPGNNFVEAIPALAEAGAKVYGRQVDGLLRVNPGERGGRVDYGDLKVVGTVENSPPAEKKK